MMLQLVSYFNPILMSLPFDDFLWGEGGEGDYRMPFPSKIGPMDLENFKKLFWKALKNHGGYFNP